MTFVPFTSVDNHKRSVTLDVALISDESLESYIWILECFRKLLGCEPIILITD